VTTARSIAPRDPRLSGIIELSQPGGAMRKSHVLVVGLALLAGYAAGVALNRPTAGQATALEALPAAQPAAVWRFQTTVVNGGGSYPLLILTDTTTGHCWVRESSPQDDEDWRDLGIPGAARK
jgi:hypothetical protein